MRQPAGWMMLKRISSVSVNAACPAVKEITAGATPASSTASGSSTQSSAVLVPMAATTAAPIANPIAVPSTPRAMNWPVFSAFERSTDSVPSTTQNECCTPVRLATNTARPRPTAPRTLLCSHTECALEVRRGALAGRRQRARDALGLPAEQAIPPAAPLGGRGQLDVARDLRGREAELLRAEARIERGEQLADAPLLAARARVRTRPPDRQLDRGAALHGEQGARNSVAGRAQTRGISGRCRRADRRRARAPSAAASLTAQVARPSVPAPGSGRACTMLFSQLRSSTSLTIVLAGVLKPVGR